MSTPTFDPRRDAPEPESDDADLEDLEIIEQWQIRAHADGKGYRAIRLPENEPYRTLSVRIQSEDLEFESDECFREELPIAVVRRLFDLRDSLIAARDQGRAALYEVERN
jgi:hypothetical protein